MLNQIATFFSTRAAKAWTGGLAAASAAFWAAISDGKITGDEIAKIVGAFVAGAIVVFLIPNAPPKYGLG